jgi:sensor histidine kinase YesM
MIRDKLFKASFIPLLGIVISYVSGIITYTRYSTVEIVLSNLYFVFVSFCIWSGCQWVHVRMRQFYRVDQNPFSKIISVCIISGIYGIGVSGMLCLIWLCISREEFHWNNVTQLLLFSLLAVIVFTLIYEILYLSKEREKDSEIVVQLDKDLTKAGIMALRNELDPHFIFNSLTALSYLISNDSEKANVFNRKLAEVYKYFLINKEKEIISLEKELEFIKSYFFILNIRHDDKLKLNINFDGKDTSQFYIIPCALQILAENAIKHNEFTFEHPLHVDISIQADYLVVQNSGKHKQAITGTPKIGLKNLEAEYHLLVKKAIQIETSGNKFIVKLPLLKNV